MENPGLLAALIQDPHPGALRVYADRLLELGDVRGELITLQLDRAERGDLSPGPRELSLRTEVLEPRLRAALGSGLTTCSWEQGFLAAVELRLDDTTPAVLATLAGRADAQLLHTLTVRAPTAFELNPVWKALGHGPRLPSLRALAVESTGEGLAAIGDTAPLYRAYPGLQRLALHGLGHELGAIELPELRSFSASRLSIDGIAPLVAARWPKLEELEVEFGPAGAEEAEPLFGPLLAAPMSSVLRRVQVRSPWPDFFRAALPRTPLGRGREVEV